MGSTVHRKRVLAKARASGKKAKAARVKKVKVVESNAAQNKAAQNKAKDIAAAAKKAKDAAAKKAKDAAAKKKKAKPVQQAPLGIRKPAKDRTNTTEGKPGIARPSQGQPNKKPLFDMTGAYIKDTTKGDNEATKKLNIRADYGGGRSPTTKKADENKKRGYGKGRKRPTTTTKKASEKNKRGYSRARTR